jgi:peroxiredoxin
LQAVLPEITSLGASLIVLTPQMQRFTQVGAKSQNLAFPILSDPGNRVGEAYGLAFRVPDDLVEVYKTLGVDLPRFNGDDSWRLSIPARIVIGRDGVVASAEADPDYTRRPEPEETVAVLRRLAKTG